MKKFFKELWSKIHPIKILFRLFLGVFIVASAVILYLRFVPISTSAFITQQNTLAKNAPKKYLPAQQLWVDFKNISPNLRLAAIATEDQLFLDHYGFDIKEIKSAIKNYNQGKKLRGASTITQQTVKNLFLWGGDKKQKRKIIEAAIVPLVELWWSKQRILEVYLNIAQFGDVIYGVEVASREFFKKSAKDLNQEEAAWLIAVLPSPSKYSIKNKSKRLVERQQWIINRMNSVYKMSKIRRFVDQ